MLAGDSCMRRSDQGMLLRAQYRTACIGESCVRDIVPSNRCIKCPRQMRRTDRRRTAEGGRVVRARMSAATVTQLKLLLRMVRTAGGACDEGVGKSVDFAIIAFDWLVFPCVYFRLSFCKQRSD